MGGWIRHDRAQRGGRRAAVVLLLLAALAGCGGGGEGGGSGGGGGGDPAPPLPPTIATAASNLFPLDAGARWTYSSSAGAAPVQVRVGATTPVAGGTGTTVRTVDANDASDYSSVYVVSSSGVREYAAPGGDAIDRALDGIELLRWPVRAGDTWKQYEGTIDSGVDYDGDGRTDRVTMLVETVAVGLEAVDTPAGRFADALRQRQTLRQTVLYSSGAPSVSLVATGETWYAPGVGPVRSSYSITGPGINETGSETLTAWRVGARGSDLVAPTVSSVWPTTPQRDVAVVVRATFSEAMDAESFTPGSFTVVDAANAAVAGRVEVTGSGVHFIANGAWASGSYTARISTAVRDVMGNALAAEHRWTFTVDLTAPGVVSSQPANGARGVALDSPIVLQFSEPVADASVVAANFELSDGTAIVPATLVVAGAQVTVLPTGGLQPGASYTLTVRNVTDVLGNWMVDSWRLSFVTVTGRFASAQPLGAGLQGGPVARGDVTGDGIDDVVMIGTEPMVSGVHNVYVFAGRSDGTLAAAQTADMGGIFPCSGPHSLALGDFNGDGRTDVAIGSVFCGAKILLQTAAGVLTPGQRITDAAAGVLRAADVDGDGRTELIGVNGNQPVHVWRPNGAGELVLAQTAAIGVGGARDVAIADFDGDGRKDFVVATYQGAGQDVVVLRQQADGSFVQAAALSTALPGGASSVAMGDFNGDGRLDIAAGTDERSPSYVALFHQTAGGSFGPLTPLPSYEHASVVRAADVDGDGRADLVVSHPGRGWVGVYLQQAAGGFSAEQRFGNNYVGFGFAHDSLVLADVTRDGRLDILVGGELLRQLPQPGTAASSAGKPMTRAARRALAAPEGRR